jgi:predicted amidophosphoribosyltransferase
VQKLIIAFKENEPAAVKAIATLVAEEMLGEDDDDQMWHRSILVAPSSTTGVGKPSLNLLATVLERIRLQQGIVVKENTHNLTRHTALITPSHRERKNIDDHLATIKLEAKNEETGPITLSDEIVVIDDVYTKGATFSACKKIILDVEPEAEVLGFFLAKTWERNDTP